MNEQETKDLVAAMTEDIMDDINFQARDHQMTGEQRDAFIKAIAQALVPEGKK